MLVKIKLKKLVIKFELRIYKKKIICMITPKKNSQISLSVSCLPRRFIHKQGLERTFVQCDNHMYRVGKRTLPRGIRVDGGSDWIALNREYCHYLVTSDDQLLKDLKAYWTYTLLPGEVGVMISTFIFYILYISIEIYEDTVL